MSQTFQPSKRKRHKSHGFLVRQGSPGGRRAIRRRRRKQRARLAV